MSIGKPGTDSIKVLTSIRFFAAIWVVFHHFGAGLVPAEWLILEAFRARGGAGVSLFFVLSGFILTLNYADRDTVSWREFVAARFARIYPLYAVGLVAALPFFANEAVQRMGLGHGLLHIGLGVALCVFLHQAWLPMHASILNPPGWSLSAEWFFYSVFPATMKHVAMRRFLESGWTAIVILWATSMALSLLVHPVLNALTGWSGLNLPEHFGTFVGAFNPLLRIPEFFIGCSLGLLHRKKPKLPQPVLSASFLLGVILAILMFAPKSRFESQLHAGLLAIPFGVLVLFLANMKLSGKSGLESPFLVLLGESSYALYVLHEPVRAWMGWAFDKVGIGWSEDVKILAFIAVSVVVSIVAFKWIESPLRPRLRSFLARGVRTQG